MRKFLDTLKEMDKKKLTILVVMFAVGVGLLLLSNMPQDKGGQALSAQEQAGIVQSAQQSEQSYEARLTAELEEILSYVDGAGEVKVMLTLASGSELSLAEDSSRKETVTEEADDKGSRRSITETSADDKTVVLRQSDGGDKPIILLEQMPRVEGVIIVAKGGGDIFVKDALIRAAQTVLGIEVHKVSVLKMK